MPITQQHLQPQCVVKFPKFCFLLLYYLCNHMKHKVQIKREKGKSTYHYYDNSRSFHLHHTILSDPQHHTTSLQCMYNKSEKAVNNFKHFSKINNDWLIKNRLVVRCYDSYSLMCSLSYGILVHYYELAIYCFLVDEVFFLHNFFATVPLFSTILKPIHILRKNPRRKLDKKSLKTNNLSYLNWFTLTG